MSRNPEQDRLVEILAETYGFKLPLRGFQRMAIEQIHGPQIEAILADGWEPERPDRAALIEELERMAAEWEQHGFAEHPGKFYADAIRRVTQRRNP